MPTGSSCVSNDIEISLRSEAYSRKFLEYNVSFIQECAASQDPQAHHAHLSVTWLLTSKVPRFYKDTNICSSSASLHVTSLLLHYTSYYKPSPDTHFLPHDILAWRPRTQSQTDLLALHRIALETGIISQPPQISFNRQPLYARLARPFSCFITYSLLHSHLSRLCERQTHQQLAWAWRPNSARSRA